MFMAIMDAVNDTIKMIPFMVVVFIAIELFEHGYGRNLKSILKGSRFIGPVLGALLGIIPQCGFSVVSTILYAQGAVTTGTLIAVYLATSDEAVPVILSQPDKINILVPLLLSKLIIAVISGYIIDILFSIFGSNKAKYDLHISDEYEDKGCCGSTCITEKFRLSEILRHSLIHSGKILLYILAVTIILNISLSYIGEDSLSSLFLKGSVFQPVIAAVIGLIPNCAVSVAITEVFISGGITFGSAIAGLSSSAGLGLIVLFKEIKNKKKAAAIILLLLLFSTVSGILLNSLLPPNYMAVSR